MDTPADNATSKRGRNIIVGAVTLAVIAVALTAGLSGIAKLTEARIERNQQAWLKERLDSLVPPTSYDNDLLGDTIDVTSPQLLGTGSPVKIHRARKAGTPVAAVVRSIAPDGYRGAIELLVAIAPDGMLIGVQVIRHNETPGLGDAFEHREAGWLDHFRGLSLSNPPQQRWTVRRDGGDFDAFTGATITPRAIVKAVRRTLEFYRGNEDLVFRQTQQR